jgi:light-regulated signal transduction histidine kinase (bacteriophytochrome)
MDQHLATTLAAAAGSVDQQTMLDRIAEGVKAATGYDRVMVYRFHPDWHGEIVAEKTEPGQPPYRGLHYPASDIPAQARRLYVETHARVIADVYARDAVLTENAAGKAAGALDLSHAWLRSVSRVHIQYLRNMGSGATLVTSLIVRGKLWGLIACHHRTPYSMPWYAFERMRQFTGDISKVIGQRLAASEAEQRSQRGSQREKLMAALTGPPAEAMKLAREILGAEGLIAYAGGMAMTLGSLPPGALELPALILGQPEDVGATDSLYDRFTAASCDAGCAGVAWLVLSRPYQMVLAFIRPEFQKTVTWGGDPDKAVVRDPVTRRLSPRGSFDLWKQTVNRRSRPWDSDTAELLEHFRDGVAVENWVAYLNQHGQSV